jgi:hypothetical protein
MLYANVRSELLHSPHVRLFALSDCIMLPRGKSKQGSTQLSAGMSLESQKAKRSLGDTGHRRTADPDRQAPNVGEKDRFFYTETRGEGGIAISHFKLLCVLWLRAGKNPILNRYGQKDT